MAHGYHHSYSLLVLLTILFFLLILLVILFDLFAFTTLIKLFQTCGIGPANLIAVHVVDTAVLAHEEHAFLTFNLNETHNLSIEHVNALRVLLIAVIRGAFLWFVLEQPLIF